MPCRTRQPRRLIAGLAATLLLVAGCATLALPTPTDAAWATGQWPGTTEADLLRGRTLYVKRCAGCHALKRPERFPTSTWQEHLDEMAKRSALAADERELVLHFLVTMSRPAIAPPSTPPNAPPSAPPIAAARSGPR